MKVRTSKEQTKNTNVPHDLIQMQGQKNIQRLCAFTFRHGVLYITVIKFGMIKKQITTYTVSVSD